MKVKPVKINLRANDSCSIPHFIPIVQHLSGFGNNEKIIVRKEYTITDFSFNSGK
jgi:hypothetical protein